MEVYIVLDMEVCMKVQHLHESLHVKFNVNYFFNVNCVKFNAQDRPGTVGTYASRISLQYSLIIHIRVLCSHCTL